MKKILIIMLVLFVAFSWSADTAEAGVRILVNNAEVIFPDQGAIVVNGRTLVPVRFISEALGASVRWIESENRVAISLGDVAISLWVGNRNVSVNGTMHTLDVAAQIVNGRTLVPLRFLSVALGAQVDWVTETSTVVVSKATLVTLSSPMQGAAGVSTTPTLHWQPAIGALSYHVRVSRHADFTDLVFDQRGITSTYVVISPALTGTLYWWTVRASNAAGDGPWSDGAVFSTIGAPGPVFLSSPFLRATGVSLTTTLRWHPVFGAISYHVQISRNALFTDLVFDQRVIDAASVVVSPALAANTEFWWSVRVRNAAGYGISTVRSFTTMTTAGPVILSSAFNEVAGVSTTPTLSWRPVATAISYQVRVSLNADFTNLVFDQQDITSTIVTVSPMLRTNTRYWWAVRVENEAGAGPWATGIFTTATLGMVPPETVLGKAGITELKDSVSIKTIATGETFMAHPRVFYGLGGADVTLMSGNPSVARVEGGNIIGIKPGIVEIFIVPETAIDQHSYVVIVADVVPQRATSQRLRVFGGYYKEVSIIDGQTLETRVQNLQRGVAQVAIVLDKYELVPDVATLATVKTTRKTLDFANVSPDEPIHFTRTFDVPEGLYRLKLFWRDAVTGTTFSSGSLVTLRRGPGGFYFEASQLYVHNNLVHLLSYEFADLEELAVLELGLDEQEAAIRRQAASIIEGVEGNFNKVRAISEWVARNIYYDMSMDNRIRKGVPAGAWDAYTVLRRRKSVCVGYTELTNALMRAAGFPARAVRGMAHRAAELLNLHDLDGVGYHAWSEVFVGDRWVIIDTTWMSRNFYDNDVYSTGQFIRWAYFDMEISTLSRSHKITNYRR